MKETNIFEILREPYHLPKKVRLFESFSGLGCQRLAFNRLGLDYESIGISEIDKYAIASYNAIHGETKNFGSICDIKGNELPQIDVFTYSFPCFTSDQLVMTNNGYKKIIDVKIGDYVLTHDNTFKEVIRNIDNGLKETIKIKGMSIHEINCTPNHKFYTRELKRVYYHNPNTQSRKFEEPKWLEAKDLTKNTYLGIAINQNSIIPYFKQENKIHSDGRVYKPKGIINSIIDKNEFWYIVGRYLGDGWLRHQGGIIICCAKDELEEITSKIDILKVNYNVIEERTVYKVHIAIKEFGEYFSQFGKGAANKRITSDVFDLPINLLEHFVNGYLDSDGSFTQGLYKTSSVSKELSYGFAQCVAKVYKTPYRIYYNDRKEDYYIEGRKGKQLPAYQVVFKKDKRKQDKAFYEDGYIWFPITSIEENQIENVYDLEVKENHSYTVNGTIVHNCTDLSKAGQQKGMSIGTRSGLVYEVLRILHEAHEVDNLPKVLIMENVVDLVQVKFIKQFQEIQLELEQLGYTNYTETLNAKNYGVAQNRDRVFMVSILGDYYYEFPKPIPLEKKLKDYLENEVDEKYYITNAMFNYLNSSSSTGKYNRKDVFERNFDEDKEVAATITTCAGNRPTDNFIKEPFCLNSKVDGKQPSVQDRIYDTEAISTCVTTSFMPSILIPEATQKGYQEAYDGVVDDMRIRKLTALECWRLMGIDDEDYEKASKVCSNAQLYKQAGNGIVIDVFAKIIEKLI